MKKVAGLACVAALAAGAAWAQGANTAAIEKQLIANERAVNTAVMKRDVKGFKALVAPDAMGIDGSGFLTVPSYEKMIAEMSLTSANVENPHVMWLSPEAAVVAYTWTGKGTWQGQPIPSPGYASTTWVKQADGKWIAKFHQETMPFPMPPQATATATTKK